MSERRKFLNYLEEGKEVTMEITTQKKLSEPEVREFMTELQTEVDSCKVNISYPYSEEFDYDVGLYRLNLDMEREKDIRLGRGFIVTSNKPINKEIKDPDGIFSPRFGQTLSDVNPHIDRYKCQCGRLKSRIRNGMMCEVCHTRVKYVDDDFKYFGWLVLNDEYVIHPNLYKTIEFLCGSQVLINMLFCEDEKDEDGHSMSEKRMDKKFKGTFKIDKRGKNEPFYGKGMRYFRQHFDEIMLYYFNHASNKMAKLPYYKDILDNRDNIFTQSIPVFTALLRPFELSENKKQFSFEGTNAIYNIMSKLVHEVNDTSLKMKRNSKAKQTALFDIQEKFCELYKEVVSILSGKKGNIRQLFGGRYSFSSREVIVQNPKLRIDEVTMPYFALVELLRLRIINILKKTYNMSYLDAQAHWYKASLEPDITVIEIINGIIKSEKRGIPVLINRNPTICKGSILQMFCVGMTFTYTLGLPLQVLQKLAADFDGDVLNVYLIINQEFFDKAYQILNPRNCMYIDNNDGYIDIEVLPYRDTIINTNTFIDLGRPYYTKEELDAIYAELQ